MNSSISITRYLTGVLLAAAVLVSGFTLLAMRAHADNGTVAPVLSAIVASPTDTGATVTWATDQNATSQVLYGPTSSYNASSTLGTATTTSHTSFLGGLSPNTMYHFQVLSGNASGTMATSSDMTFTTASSTTMASTTSFATTTVQVMIMKHLCNANIHNLQDFVNLGSGKGPVATLAADVLACPTTGLIGNAAVAGAVASPRTTYNFTVTNNAGSQTLSANGMYMPHQLCESDLNLDVDGNGQIASTTCLDISHYMIPVTGSSSQITVTESAPPSGYHFGTVRFTPPVIDGNNDANSLISTDANAGSIMLNATHDTDGMIMLHIYNFPNAATTTATTTDTTGLQAQIDALKARVSALEAEIAALLGMGGGTTTPPTGGTGMIDADKNYITAGHAMDLSGRNFGHEETVRVTLNGNLLVATAHADGGGNFSTGSFTAPTTAGTYTFVFTGQTSGITGSINITVH